MTDIYNTTREAVVINLRPENPLEFNLEYHYKNYKLTYDFSLVRGENLTQYEPLSYINPDKDQRNIKISESYQVKYTDDVANTYTWIFKLG